MSVLSPDPISWFYSIIPDHRQWRDSRSYPIFNEHSGPLIFTTTILATIAIFNLSYIYLRKKQPMMLLSACVSFAATMVLLVMPLPSLAVDTTVDQDLVTKLKQAATMNDRLHLLSDQQFLYNFSANPMYSWSPGSVCNANAATWPILSTFSSTVAQLNLGPCSMLAPHLHRANNLVVAVTGTTQTYMVQENGARLVQQMLTPGLMTIFPKASLHSMYNMGCENNQLYSFLDDSDPATLNVAQAFFMMPQDMGMQVMPFINLTDSNWTATGQQIPAVGTGSQGGFEACMKTCGLSMDGSSSGPVRK